MMTAVGSQGSCLSWECKHYYDLTDSMCGGHGRSSAASVGVGDSTVQGEDSCNMDPCEHYRGIEVESGEDNEVGNEGDSSGTW